MPFYEKRTEFYSLASYTPEICRRIANPNHLDYTAVVTPVNDACLVILAHGAQLIPAELAAEIGRAAEEGQLPVVFQIPGSAFSTVVDLREFQSADYILTDALSFFAPPGYVLSSPVDAQAVARTIQNERIMRTDTYRYTDSSLQQRVCPNIFLDTEHGPEHENYKSAIMEHSVPQFDRRPDTLIIGTSRINFDVLVIKNKIDLRSVLSSLFKRLIYYREIAVYCCRIEQGMPAPEMRLGQGQIPQQVAQTRAQLVQRMTEAQERTGEFTTHLRNLNARRVRLDSMLATLPVSLKDIEHEQHRVDHSKRMQIKRHVAEFASAFGIQAGDRYLEQIRKYKRENQARWQQTHAEYMKMRREYSHLLSEIARVSRENQTARETLVKVKVECEQHLHLLSRYEQIMDV